MMSDKVLLPVLMLWVAVAVSPLIPIASGLECFQCVDILNDEMRRDLKLETSPLCSGGSVTTSGLKTEICGIGMACVSVRGLATVQRTPGFGYRTSVPIIGRTCWPNGGYRSDCDEVNYSEARSILEDLTGREVTQFREGRLCFCESNRCSLDCPGIAYPKIGSHCVDWWLVFIVCLVILAVLIALGCVCCRRRRQARAGL